MNDRSELLMVKGIVRPCADCSDERIFMPVDECDSDACEFCCTSCGAAVMIDPVYSTSAVVNIRVA